MKKIVVLLGILFVAFNGFSQNQSTPSSEELKRKEIISLLKDIEGSYFKYLNYDERRIAINKLDKALMILQQLTLTSTNQNAIPNVAIADDSFEVLLKEVSSTNDHAEKNRKVTLVSKTSFFNCNQIKSLLATYTWDKDKVEIIKIIYSRVIDKQNILLVTSTVTNSIEQKELEDWILSQK